MMHWPRCAHEQIPGGAKSTSKRLSWPIDYASSLTIDSGHSFTLLEKNLLSVKEGFRVLNASNDPWLKARSCKY